jgi:hypothetical protein
MRLYAGQVDKLINLGLINRIEEHSNINPGAVLAPATFHFDVIIERYVVFLKYEGPESEVCDFKEENTRVFIDPGYRSFQIPSQHYLVTTLTLDLPSSQ